MAAGAATALVPGYVRRAAAASGPTVAELRGGLLQIAGVGGNVLLFRGTDGVAMVDSGAPEHADTLAALVDERLGGASVDYLLNTHWHLEHTGGNDRFGAAGATIVAHENTRLWMSTEFYDEWHDRRYPARAPEAVPTRTFYASDPQPIEIALGDERIEYGYLREAHTDGDIYVRFVERNVIAAGGAVTVGRYPVPDPATGGWIGGTAASVAKLLEIADDDTLIVPDVGPPQRRAHLEAELEMLEAIRNRMEERMHKGRSAADMLAEGITADFDARWGNNAEEFLSKAYDSLWWGGRIRGTI